MRKNTLSRFAGVVLAAIFTCSILPGSSAAGPIKLSYANFGPIGTFLDVQMKRWKKELEKRTDGKVAISTFPGGSLLGAKNMFYGVISGQADIGCICMAYQPGRFTINKANSFPL